MSAENKRFNGRARLNLANVLLHTLLFLRLTEWMEPWGWWEWSMLALLCGTSACIWIGAMRRGRMDDRGDRAVQWIGFAALGLFSSIGVLTIIRDTLMLGAWVVGFQTSVFEWWSSRAVVGLAISMSLIGFRNAVRLAGVRTVKVPVDGLPKDLEGFTIVQLSDIHVGPMVRRRHVERIVERVNSLGADLVAITGDVVDGSVEKLRSETEPLGQLSAKHGTALVIGNHELYSGAAEWIDEFKRLGARVLLNEHVVLHQGSEKLVVAGITDHTTAWYMKEMGPDAKKALDGSPSDAGARLLLGHQPRSAQYAEGLGFDLFLCGHTHGGQYWPFNYFVPMQQPLVAGLHKRLGMWIFVHRGTGFWGPPKRLLAPSEITRVQLVGA